MKEITDFYKSYFYIRKNKLPYITAKLACSNDYYIYSKKIKILLMNYLEKLHTY